MRDRLDNTLRYSLKVILVALVAYGFVCSYVSRAVEKDATFWSALIVGASILVWVVNKIAVVLYTTYAPSRLKSSVSSIRDSASHES